MTTPLDERARELLEEMRGGTPPVESDLDAEAQALLEQFRGGSTEPSLEVPVTTAGTPTPPKAGPVVAAGPPPLSFRGELEKETEDILAPAEPGTFLSRSPELRGLETIWDIITAANVPLDVGSEFLMARPEELVPQFTGQVGPDQLLSEFRERPGWEQVLAGIFADPTVAITAPLAGARALPSLVRGARRATDVADVARPARAISQLPERAPAPSARPQQLTPEQLLDEIRLEEASGAATRQAEDIQQVPLEQTPEQVLEEIRVEGPTAETPARQISELQQTPLADARQEIEAAQILTDIERASGRQFDVGRTQRLQAAEERIAQGQRRLQEAANESARLQMRASDISASLPEPARLIPREPTLSDFRVSDEPFSLRPTGDVVEGGLQEILAQFRRVLNDPTRADEWKETLIARRRELGRRSGNFRDRVNALVAEGVPTEEAINVATRELSGELPSVQTPLHELATPYIRDALFQEVYTQLADEPLEMRATATALTNALSGKPIPRTPGTSGGSAFSRLQRVFGEDITNAITQRRSLQEVIAFETQEGLGLTRFQGPRTPFIDQPSTQTFGAARQIGGQQTFGQLPTERLTPEDILTPQQQPLISQAPMEPMPPRKADLRPQYQKDIDLQVFREATGEAPSPLGLTDEERALLDIPPDEIIRQSSMFAETGKERLARYAREAGLTVLDVGNLLRANLATFDLSYLRQQALLTSGNPVEFAQSFRDSLRSLFSAKYARQIDDWIRSDPDMKYYDLLDIDFLRPLEGREGRRLTEAWERAEDFMILGGQRPLQRLAEKIPWIRISGRAYVTGMNSMNWRIWKGHMRMLHRLMEESAAGRATLPEGFDFNRSARDYGNMLADFSGRGPLPERLRPLSPILNNMAFSLRLNIGRLITPRHLFFPEKYTRQAAWKNMLTGVGTIAGLVTAGAMMGWWRTEDDSRSSDFGKIIVGNTRIDPWGGYQQYYVLYSRLLPFVGGIKSATTGKVSDYDPVTGIARFSRSKAAPLVNRVLQEWTGKDFIGRPIDRTDWRYWLAENAPLAAQDVFEAYEQEGLLGLALGVPGFFGFGVTTFDPNENDVAQELYGVDYDEIPVGRVDRVDYRKRVREEVERRKSLRQIEKEEDREAQLEEKRKERQAERHRIFQEATR